ncbi:unnamed protein product (macronuclear) [Paramecium tetraurelia]|uniref:Uncharacterized protein n=1 Tax=Paramecium tetraurelia TaxID=5888 RepID=A0BDI3_PARTE|nr:uncharacterized protein GSPATT00027629001 [Paramecium tetraurelia]CAK56600.1 unnamed protein product [Paramecium tetraurelia]|eukprot:XP_001423998.1 hypothetical protein (macronuclear) [Paramecium tetraurelia strain d4-2]
MSTFEKVIQKQRKLNKQFEFTHNSTESHSNASFFDEERSQDFSDSDISYLDNTEMSSNCTDDSNIPPQSQDNIANFNSMPLQDVAPMKARSANQRIVYLMKGINNNNSQTGKGIAIHVLGQGSIGKLNKKGKKLEKCNKKQIQNLNNQININNNNLQDQQSQQSPSSNFNSNQQSISQQNKQTCQIQKVILAYLMVESDVLKQAQQRAQNFIEKFMPNINDKELQVNIQETYKIMLLPDQIIQQLAQVLSEEERLLHLNLCLHRLNLKHNKHPLAAKAADKITMNLKQSC